MQLWCWQFEFFTFRILWPNRWRLSLLLLLLPYTGCFFNCSAYISVQKEKRCSTNEDLLYIENFMEQNLWLAAHNFSFWFWKLGVTVKRSHCIFYPWQRIVTSYTPTSKAKVIINNIKAINTKRIFWISQQIGANRVERQGQGTVMGV